MVQKWRKKPVVIEAVQWSGNNQSEILEFCKDFARVDIGNKLEIITLEGVMTASINDYIIKGINGEFYPCKPNIFAKTYDLVVEHKQDISYDDLREPFFIK
jgi:hypothetical protein